MAISSEELPPEDKVENGAEVWLEPVIWSEMVLLCGFTIPTLLALLKLISFSALLILVVLYT